MSKQLTGEAREAIDAADKIAEVLTAGQQRTAKRQQWTPDRNSDVAELEAAIALCKSGDSVIWSSARDALDRLAANKYD